MDEYLFFFRVFISCWMIGYIHFYIGYIHLLAGWSEGWIKLHVSIFAGAVSTKNVTIWPPALRLVIVGYTLKRINHSKV